MGTPNLSANGQIAPASWPDGLEFVQTILARTEPLLEEQRPKQPKIGDVNFKFLKFNSIVAEPAAKKLGAALAKAAVEGALAQHIGAVPAAMAGDALGEVTKELIAAMFARSKEQSSTDKMLNDLIVRPLNKAQEQIESVLTADWDTDTRKVERTRRLTQAHDELCGIEGSLAQKPELRALVRRLIMLTDALVPASRPALDAALKSLRQRADVDNMITGSLNYGTLSRWMVARSIQRLPSAPIAWAPGVTPHILAPQEKPAQMATPNLVWQTPYTGMGWQWALPQTLSNLLAPFGLGFIGFAVGALITSFAYPATTFTPSPTLTTDVVADQIRSANLNKSAQRIRHFCNLLEWIADNTEEFFALARKQASYRASPRF